MKNNFPVCLDSVLADEGGYTNDPSDKGGPTNYGITLTDCRKYWKKNATAQDVRYLPLDKAKDIYQSKYWNPLGCDDLPSGVDYTCFDYGVNSGLGRPRKALQRFKSLTGTKLIDAICDERVTFLNDLVNTEPSQRKFLKGWLKRVERVRSYSKKLATQDNTSGPIGGGLLVGLGTYISQFFHNHEYLVISSGIATGIITGILIHLYKNKGK